MEKKVLVVGCNGHMGRIVCELLESNTNLQIFGGFDKKFSGKESFNTYSEVKDLPNFEEIPDVIIDFSTPEATLEILEYAEQCKIPIVIATTGLTENDMNIIHQTSKNIPIFQSANMSFEVNLVKKVLQLLAPQLSDSDIEISETHHNRKVDSPSGTAKMFADAINSALANSMDIMYGRTGKRKENEIGISSLRGGNIVGTHSIQFFGKFETLEITHTALSRELFAEGSIKAAEFLIEQPAGFYNMDDLVNIML